MKLLITGGGGFIGSRLSSKLIDNHMITINDTFLPSTNELGAAKLLCSNFWGRDVIDALESIECVIHLAGISDGFEGEKNPDKTMDINYEKSKVLIDACKQAKVRYFIYFSTIGVYGSNSPELKDECALKNPADFYSKSKLSVEEYLINQTSEDFSALILRPGMVFGYSKIVKHSQLINRLIKSALHDNQIKIFGGHQTKPQVYIDDLTHVVQLLIEKHRWDRINIYNVVADNPSLEELSRIIKQNLPSIEIEKLPFDISICGTKISSKKLLEAIQGFKFSSLEDGIIKTLRQYELDKKRTNN